MIAAGIVAGLGALAALLQSNDEGREAAHALGTATGSLAVTAIIGWLFWQFRSRQAGLIAAIVVGSLVIITNVAQIGDRTRTERQLEEAIDELGLPTPAQAFEPTDAEIECLDDSGFDGDDLLTALTDTGSAGAAGQAEFFDVVVRCAPRALLTDTNVEQFRLSFSTGLQSEISTEEARCLLGELAELPSPSTVLNGDDLDALVALFERCLSEESLALVRGDPGSGAQLIGDDPVLDRLAERCRADDDVACDVLFGRTAAGSEYALVAGDCGGRSPQNTVTCSEGFVDGDLDGFLDEASPGWTRVLADCRAGDMLSCDFAFANAEFGSETERVGETCGERRAVSVGGTCVERFGEQAE